MTGEALAPEVLPDGIRSGFLDDVNGLRVHILEAGDPGQPLVLLLHGFPELAYSWRKIMLPLAEAGYHVVAPDQRGYGFTTGWTGSYHDDLAHFRIFNLVRDAMGVVWGTGHTDVAAVFGHDFGSPVAAWCALLRPDLFKRVAMMSAPIGQGATVGKSPGMGGDIHADLAALERPRKHYQWYYSTPEADADMLHCPQGVHDFLRAYYHHKSADWSENQPFKLGSWTAGELARMPTYYIMDLGQNMAETVAPEMPSPEHVAACTWLPDEELRIYSEAFGRTGFQAALNWYRCGTSGRYMPEMELFAGRTIDVPSCFIAGASDWGVYQKPGDFERMQDSFCTDMRSCHLIDGAGHWVQQEQPVETARLLNQFLDETA